MLPSKTRKLRPFNIFKHNLQLHNCQVENTLVNLLETKQKLNLASISFEEVN